MDHLEDDSGNLENADSLTNEADSEQNDDGNGLTEWPRNRRGMKREVVCLVYEDGHGVPICSIECLAAFVKVHTSTFRVGVSSPKVRACSYCSVCGEACRIPENCSLHAVCPDRQWEATIRATRILRMYYALTGQPIDDLVMETAEAVDSKHPDWVPTAIAQQTANKLGTAVT